MTPESVLKAMAEALAEKYTYTPEGAKRERPLEERVNDGMAVKFPNGYLGTSMRPTKAQEAATTAMEVVGPVLELLFRLAETAHQMAKSHKEFIDEWARHDVDAHTQEIQYVMERLLEQIKVKEPADWGYVSRFSATPNEIHDLLREGLHPDVHLNYQQAIGRAIQRQAAEEIREARYDVHTAEDAAARIDPDMGGVTLPRGVVDPEG